jgi:predicted kinase
MRKWMSERFKRRKKAEEKSSAEAGPAPLQPKYFDADASEPLPAAEVREAGPESAPAEAEPASDSSPAAVIHTPQPSPADPRRSRRRRRGRGGRGRNGSAAPAAGIVPSAPPPVVPEASVPTPLAAAPVVSSTPKGTVILAIGLPGSGKSAWFKRHNITPLSSDLLRVLLFDDPTEQRFQDLIFSNLRSMLKARLIARRPLNYVDATNLTPHERRNWISLAHDYDYDVQAVYFDVPLEVCLERNQRRERVVPEDVMRRMASKLKAPGFDEGFSKITVVKVKKKENVPAEEETS